MAVMYNKKSISSTFFLEDGPSSHDIDEEGIHLIIAKPTFVFGTMSLQREKFQSSNTIP